MWGMWVGWEGGSKEAREKERKLDLLGSGFGTGRPANFVVLFFKVFSMYCFNLILFLVMRYT